MKPSTVAVRDIRNAILAALGPRQLTQLRHDNIPADYWPWSYHAQFYPFHFVCDTFLHRLWMREPWAELIEINTNWIDLADWFAQGNDKS